MPRTLGQSRLLALTALVPFLGTLILFNQQLVDLLLLSPTLVGRWVGQGDHSAIDASRAFTLNRLQVTYFGLVFLGVGSFLFAVLCPPEVKRSPTISEYIETEKPLITKARTGLLVNAVATDYLRNHGEEEARGPRFLRELAYPPAQETFFHFVITEITEALEWGVEEAAEQGQGEEAAERASSAQIEDDAPTIDESIDVWTGVGTVHIEKVARILYNRIRLYRAFWASFENKAVDHITDLLALRYLALDHSKPTFRIIVSGSYFIGFATLFYPTVVTFFLILRQLIGL
jgi:hypothetical protein